MSLEILNTILIPDITNIVESYHFPDYKLMFDMIITEINLGCVHWSLININCECAHNCTCYDEYEKIINENWEGSFIQKYDDVLFELRDHFWNTGHILHISGSEIGYGRRWTKYA